MSKPQAVYVGNGRVLTRTANGFKLFVDGSDVSIAPHLILDGVWEEWTEATLRRVVKTGMRALEIGANVGYFTLLIAQQIGPTGKLRAFECDPELAQIAEDNVELNGFADRCDIDRRAVGESAGQATFNRARRHRGGGTLVQGLQQIPQLRESEREAYPVTVTTIDELLRNGEAPYDFVKIDAEGAETAIVNGGQSLFAREKRPLALLIEFCPSFLRTAGHDPAEELRRFAAWGFSFARLDERKRRAIDCTADALLARDYSELLLTR